MNIIVTGASSGIGFEVAKLLAEKHQVIAVARRGELLSQLAEKSIISPILVEGDLTKQDCIDQIIAAINKIGDVDILINNAGYLVNKPLVNMPKEEIAAIFDINVFSAVELSVKLIPYFNTAGGHIVNISGMGGFQGTQKFPGLAAYSASKAALISFTECMAVELQNTNISVNCIALGAVETEMLSCAFPDYKAPVTADEMAEMIASFALTGKKFHNGQIIPASLSTP